MADNQIELLNNHVVIHCNQRPHAPESILGNTLNCSHLEDQQVNAMISNELNKYSCLSLHALPESACLMDIGTGKLSTIIHFVKEELWIVKAEYRIE